MKIEINYPLFYKAIISNTLCKLSVMSLLLAMLSPTARADDWPSWLGANRDGVWRETGILKSFPPDGPMVVWRHKISSGYAGPAVAAGKVYVTDRLVRGADPTAEQKDHYAIRAGAGVERVWCLQESNGEVLWKHEYDCPYKIAYPAGPRATPTVDQNKVYTLGAQGNLFCLDATDGKVIWSCDFTKVYNLKVPSAISIKHRDCLLNQNSRICFSSP